LHAGSLGRGTPLCPPVPTRRNRPGRDLWITQLSAAVSWVTLRFDPASAREGRGARGWVASAGPAAGDPVRHTQRVRECALMPMTAHLAEASRAAGEPPPSLAM